tara:strand:+ start:1141 stop:2913 length:1773 start_codon:yes stop_codon:yes gene_type:complete
MALEERLFSATEPNKKIVIVETMPLDSEKYEMQKREVENKFKDIFERNILIETKTPGQIEEESTNLKDSILLLNGNESDWGPLVNLRKLIQIASLSKKITDNNSNVEYSIMLRCLGGDFAKLEEESGSPVKMALNRSMSALGFKEAVSHLEGMGNSKTIIDYIESKLGSIAHEIGAKKDAEFIDELSSRFLEGNLQTTINQTFLIVSDRLKNLEGKFEIIKQDTNLSEADLNKYAAIFVDNNFSLYEDTGRLGKGIGVLERLAKQKLHIPIIYQTAHLLDEFTQEEIERIESFPNTILMPKNYAPKISKSKKVAQKELIVGELAKKSPNLSKYTAQIRDVGENGFIKIKDKYITFTKAAKKNIEEDVYKLELLKELGIQNNKTNHKMYVLSLFHTDLKEEMKNEKLKLVGKDFFEFNKIRENISKEGEDFIKRIDTLNDNYQAIVKKHREYEPKVLTHNDAKWDNWFYGHTLGDFGSVCPGREYKDIAKVLLNPEKNFRSTLNKKHVDRSIFSYLKLRKELDSEFKENPEEFRKNIYEMLVTESLRTAHYKSGTGKSENTKLVDGLLKIAEKYSKVLLDKKNMFNIENKY